MALSKSLLAESAGILAKKDKDLARILANYGTPPFWPRDQGFITLLHIILEQQVSLISADAMFRRLTDYIEPLTPRAVLDAGTAFLRSFGVTRQKAAYFINVAEAIVNGELDLQALTKDSDDVAMERLTSVKGIGPWTANIYLLMALRRPDVWPVGDVALATAFKNIKGRKQRPTQAELNEIAKTWRPHRATAARMLWHYYLCAQNNSGAPFAKIKSGKNLMNNPIISDNKPKKATLNKDEKYFFCVCGRSENQPFCDGSHKGTSFTPKAFTPEKDGDAWLCACKNTGNTPYCDGTHKQFSAEQVGKEGPGTVKA